SPSTTSSGLRMRRLPCDAHRKGRAIEAILSGRACLREACATLAAQPACGRPPQWRPWACGLRQPCCYSSIWIVLDPLPPTPVGDLGMAKQEGSRLPRLDSPNDGFGCDWTRADEQRTGFHLRHGPSTPCTPPLSACPRLRSGAARG